MKPAENVFSAPKDSTGDKVADEEGKNGPTVMKGTLLQFHAVSGGVFTFCFRCVGSLWVSVVSSRSRGGEASATQFFN